MSRLKRLVAVLAATVFFLLPAHADILRLKIDDTIHPITEEYIARAIDKAREQKAELVLIELRTPGGLLNSTRKIIEKILASEVPVVVFVTPSGGYAASAGFFILQAADVAAMSPGTNTGTAHPVLGLGVTVDEIMKSKMENDAAAFMRSFVSKRGRNLEAAESAVRQSKSFTEKEALDQKLIDLVASNDSDLLAQLDGRVINRFDGKSVTLHTKGVAIQDLAMSVRQRTMAFLMDPNITFLLFCIGLLALYGEFNHPGAVIPGVVGTVAIILVIFALNLLPTRLGAVALIACAFLLFALEVKYASHGVLGIGGTVLMVIGAMLLVDGPIPEMRVKFLTAISVSVPLALITIFLTTIAYRAHRAKIQTGPQAMIGALATAKSPLTPAGKVELDGELWNAIASSPVAIGDKVVVREVKGLELEVDKA